MRVVRRDEDAAEPKRIAMAAAARADMAVRTPDRAREARIRTTVLLMAPVAASAARIEMVVHDVDLKTARAAPKPGPAIERVASVHKPRVRVDLAMALVGVDQRPIAANLDRMVLILAQAARDQTCADQMVLAAVAIEDRESPAAAIVEGAVRVARIADPAVRVMMVSLRDEMAHRGAPPQEMTLADLWVNRSHASAASRRQVVVLRPIVPVFRVVTGRRQTAAIPVVVG